MSSTPAIALITAIILGIFVKVPWQLLRMPTAFPDRLAVIPEENVVINNTLYDSPTWVWHDEDHPLLNMNAARVPYFVEAFKHIKGFSEGERIIDIGCGGGLVSEAMAKMGYTITGIDLSEYNIHDANEHAAPLGLKNLDYVVGSAYALPFPDNAFAGIIYSDVLEHLHDLTTAISEIARVLRPGGVLVFDTVNRSTHSYYFAWLLAQETFGVPPSGTHDWKLFITPDEMTRGLKKVGLVTAPRTEIRGIEPTVRWPGLRKLRKLHGWLGPWKQSMSEDGVYAWWAAKPEHSAKV